MCDVMIQINTRKKIILNTLGLELDCFNEKLFNNYIVNFLKTHMYTLHNYWV